MQAVGQDDEAMLWYKFQQGHPSALDAIYRLHVNALYNYGRKINPETEQVKDCIQDLFVELWQRRQRLNLPDNPRFYLLSALRYKLLRQHHLQTKFDNFTTDKSEPSVPSYESELLRLQLHAEQNSALKSAIDKLSSRQKEALVFRYYEGMSCEEIAGLMELKVQSVYNLLHQSLHLLRQDLLTSFVHFDLLLITSFLSFLIYSC